MKQHITIEQLRELTNKQKEELLVYFHMPLEARRIYFNGKYKKQREKAISRLVNIGKMIEILGDRLNNLYMTGGNFIAVIVGCEQMCECCDLLECKYRFIYGEFCDALWEAVKTIL